MNEIKKFFYPMLADPFGEVARGQNRVRWEKYKLLSPDEKEIIVSDELASGLESLGSSYNLSDKEGEILSDIVRRIFLKELSENDVQGSIQKNISSLDVQSINSLHLDLLRVIRDAGTSVISRVSSDKNIEVASIENEEKKHSFIIQLKLQEALKKFEKLGEQHLSANPIKLKIFDAPVRPSIKNWISDYYEKVDARKHDSIERGNYLFHSENARRLTTGERQKVGTMLKALDEDGVVIVDQGKQELIFQGETLETQDTRHKIQDTNNFQNSNNTNTQNNSGGVSFSSGHKFPYEQKTNVQAPAEQRQPLRPAMNRPQYDNLGFTPPRRQDSRPSNNVVDLRE